MNEPAAKMAGRDVWLFMITGVGLEDRETPINEQGTENPPAAPFCGIFLTVMLRIPDMVE